MEKETLKNIFDFLEKNDNKNKPFKWKLLNNVPLTEDELTIKGNLDLDDSEIKTLPEDLQVNGFLSLAESDIESLPEGLSIGRSLNLSYCKEITSLPKGLEVGWNLNIRGTKLQKYTDDELREMIKPGFLKGEIYRG